MQVRLNVNVVMGNLPSADRVLGKENLEEYVELTYLNKNEIRHIFNLLDEVDPGKLKKNLHHRFSMEQVDKIMPQIRLNPFHDSIYRVFSSRNDDFLTFEDILDLCSAFSENCPESVRAAWAFAIFDLDGDNQVSHGDLVGAVERLTRFGGVGQPGIDTEHAEQVARMILKEMDLAQMGGISSQEFVRLVSRMPDFAHAFSFKV